MFKNILLLLSILLLSLLLVSVAYILKEDEICCSIELCRNINTICEDKDEQEDDGDSGNTILSSEKDVEFVIYNLKVGSEISSGYEISGEVIGGWYFEGEFPVRVLSMNGDLLDTSIAYSQGDWMTSDKVVFKVVIDHEVDSDTDVVIRFDKSNPSGLTEYEDFVSIPVTILDMDSLLTVKVYFPNTKLNDMTDCSDVYEVSRTTKEKVAVGRASLELLLQGPNEDELEDGYFTNIPKGVEIQSLNISNGVARVDFNNKLQEGVGGSCRVESIRSQISETLKQFPTVQEVIISIDGNTEDILQP